MRSTAPSRASGAESLAPDADGGIWWRQVLEESVKHTVGVSQDLREGVRLSIEIIANEVVRRRRAQGLDPLPQAKRSRWPARRCAICTGSSSCSMPRLRPSWRCCRSARGSTSRATGWTGCAS